MFLQRDRIGAVTVADVMRVAETLSQSLPTGRWARSSRPRSRSARNAGAVDLPKVLEGYKGSAAVAQGGAFDPSPANVEARAAPESSPANEVRAAAEDARRK